MTTKIALFLIPVVLISTASIPLGQTTTATLSGVIRQLGRSHSRSKGQRSEQQHGSDARNQH